MSAAKPDSTIDLTSIPRAVLSVAVGMVHSVERAVIGDARIRTARGNAWEAICADRERALRRDEIRALVASLAAAPPVGPATVAARGSTAARTAAAPRGSTAARQPVS
ncbi:hypothetical protein V1634_11190 [Plantactinospora veratri]|uniref:Uncharacterized protein n=1 Tax=Plantactinospora veratri TaxID=1436122 RepID=A0ABU7SBR3_9ACTN